jgi:hypothetical protein
LPLFSLQEPPLSQLATLSQVVPSAAFAAAAPRRGMAMAEPVTPAATRIAGA